MSDKQKLLVIDGYALIFRAYYAFIKTTSFTTKSGEPTGAIFGFIRMIISSLNTLKPDYVVVAWDSGGKTFRNDIYPEYKANRKETPTDLKIQIPHIIDSINKFDISSIAMPNYEADDIIGTICEKLRGKNEIDVIILSGDKDLLQLVGDNVTAMANKKGVSEFDIFDREAVKEKWGVYPENFIDLLSIIGDSSDNVPGIKGIGDKGAVQLVNEFGSLDNIFANLNKIGNKRNKTILEKPETKQEAELSKTLVTIKRDLDLQFNLEDFKSYDFTSQEAIEIYDKFELRSIKSSELPKKKGDKVELIKINTQIKLETEKPIKQQSISYDGQQALFDFITPIDDTVKKKEHSIKGKYRAITSKAEFEKLISDIKKAETLSFDFETTSEEPVRAEPIGFSLSWKEGESVYIPIKHNISIDFDMNDVIDFLKKIFYDNNIKIVGQNIKYEYIILRNLGIIPINFYFDTMLAAYILDPDNSPFNMDSLADRLLGYTTIKYSDIVPKKATLLDVEFSKVIDYACEDSDITLRLYNVLKPKIDNSKMKELFYNIEMPLICVLGNMELAGVSINVKYFSEMSKQMGENLKALEKEIYKLNDGIEFNINSPKQLQEILFDKLGLESTKKTGKGARSTNVYALESLANKHQIPKLILEYRTIAKLKNTYLDTLPKMIYNKTNRIHASFNQAIVATGRLSSNNPNMQNIPIKGDLGKQIRRGFIPSENNVILSADYSQIELRLLAHFSQEPKLIEAYLKSKDLHLQTASLLFGKDENSITPDERTKGKTINFSIIYGIGAKKLASDLNIKTKEASDLISSYFKQYPKVREFINNQIRETKDQIAVYTFFNRVRYIKQFMSKSRVDRSHAERLSVNSPIQGTSADLIKIAMIRICEEFKHKNLKSKLIIQVHDELVFDVVENEIEEVKNIVKTSMENAAKLRIPLKVSINIGKNWDEAH